MELVVNYGSKVQHILLTTLYLSKHGPGTAKLQLLQDAWVECDGAWKKSSLYKRMMERTTHKHHGARLWLTRSQIALKYNSEDIAASICDAKLSDPELLESHTRPHPDCPKEEAWNFLSVHWLVARGTGNDSLSCGL